MKNEPFRIDIARDFSKTPGGRYRRDGEYSGEEFRDDILDPKLSVYELLIIDLDGPIGFTTSFLEEVFGGLVRKYGPQIKDRVVICADARPIRAKKARAFMDRAIATYKGR